MYIEMENVISNLTKTSCNTYCRQQHGFKNNYVQDAHTHTHTHTRAHTHMLYRLIMGEGQCCLATDENGLKTNTEAKTPRS